MLRLITASAAVGITMAASAVAADIPLVRRANAWQRGQRIPAELLAFRDLARSRQR
jgi:H+/gluconate symporter-like permease